MRSLVVAVMLLLSLGCGGVRLATPPTREDVERCAELSLPARATHLELEVIWGIDCLTRTRFDLPDRKEVKAFAALVGCAPGPTVDEKGRPLYDFTLPPDPDAPPWWRERPPPSAGVRACNTPFNSDYGRSLWAVPHPDGTVTVYFSHMDI
jgi:hypothetical protein